MTPGGTHAQQESTVQMDHFSWWPSAGGLLGRNSQIWVYDPKLQRTSDRPVKLASSAVIDARIRPCRAPEGG
jgi:hypothetical protein